jgi:hypothetical protein
MKETMAKDKFTKGQRVATNELAIKMNVVKTRRLATVLGFGLGPGRKTVRIRFDDRKAENSFHMDFLDPVEEGRTRP